MEVSWPGEWLTASQKGLCFTSQLFLMDQINVLHSFSSEISFTRNFMPTKILNNFILVSMARRRNKREKRRSIINHRIADVHLCSQAGSFYRIFLCSCGGFSAFSRACEHNIPHIKLSHYVSKPHLISHDYRSNFVPPYVTAGTAANKLSEKMMANFYHDSAIQHSSNVSPWRRMLLTICWRIPGIRHLPVTYLLN